MVEISAVIITKNEAAHIGACIRSLAGVADEVVVIDDFSEDETALIAQRLGATVICHRFEGFGAQKNFGAEQASFDWILSIDADEQLSETLRDNLLRLKQTTLNGAYQFCRLNFIGNRAIRTCGWYPDKKVRLFNRNHMQWNLAEVHEKPEALVKGHPILVTDVKGDLLHFSYADLKQMEDRGHRYAQRAAAALPPTNKTVLVFKMMVHPFWKWLRTFVFQRGFLDGKYGVAVSRNKARETFLKYYFAWK